MPIVTEALRIRLVDDHAGGELRYRVEGMNLLEYQLAAWLRSQIATGRLTADTPVLVEEEMIVRQLMNLA